MGYAVNVDICWGLSYKCGGFVQNSDILITHLLKSKANMALPFDLQIWLLCNFKASHLAKLSVIAAHLFNTASQPIAQTWKDVNLLSMKDWALNLWHCFFVY